MKAADTRALLAQYVNHGSETAFRDLVECYPQVRVNAWSLRDCLPGVTCLSHQYSRDHCPSRKTGLESADGSWQRTYAFADGQPEIHKAADGNLEPWEAQHTFRSPGTGLSRGSRENGSLPNQ